MQLSLAYICLENHVKRKCLILEMGSLVTFRMAPHGGAVMGYDMRNLFCGGVIIGYGVSKMEPHGGAVKDKI